MNRTSNSIQELPVPEVYGLPSRFDSWRQGQSEAILDAQDSTSRARFTAQVQPTGSGKSICYIALAAMEAGRTLILTSTKGLQKQLDEDFGIEPGLKLVMGKNEYRCKLLSENYSCDFGPCNFGKHCAIKNQCYYYQAIETAKRAKIVVTNYSFWAANLPDVLGDFSFLVCDEAHDTVTQLCSVLAISITRKSVEKCRLNCLEFPLPDSEAQLWKWGINTLKNLTAEISEKIKNGNLTELLKNEDFRAQYTLKNALTNLAGQQSNQWVCELVDDALAYDPSWPADFAEDYLFRSIPKVFLTSATVTPKIIELLGIDDYCYFEYPSHFPVQNRPVMHIPTARMDFRISQEHLRLWLGRIDQIIRPRLDRKGIVHTVSYRNCQQILDTSEFSAHMLTHKSGDRDFVISEFRASSPPRILVSPAVVTGYDFPYSQCEYQIIGKIPFPDQRKLVDRRRREIDPEFGINQACQLLVQMVGRGMRAPDDHCETFIIDDHVGWFIHYNSHLLPKAFLDSYRRGVHGKSTIPLPPPKLKQ